MKITNELHEKDHVKLELGLINEFPKPYIFLVNGFSYIRQILSGIVCIKNEV